MVIIAEVALLSMNEKERPAREGTISVSTCAVAAYKLDAAM